MKVFAQNKKAHYNYELLERLEAGLILLGSEVKAIREGKASIGESFIIEKHGELFLHNAHISKLSQSTYFSHEPLRHRKLLLKQREIRKLIGQMTRKQMTVVPIRMYASSKGIIKVEIAVAKGRQKADKREAIKEREWKRDQSRLMRTEMKNS